MKKQTTLTGIVTASLLMTTCLAHAKHGIDYVDDTTGILYIVSEGWTGNFRYLCINSACVNGELVNGRFERVVTGLSLGESYNVEFKIQDNAMGQHLEEGTVIFTDNRSTDTPATPEPTPQPDPEPTPQPDPEPTPQPDPEPTPQPDPEPTPQPDSEPTPQPDPEPTPQPDPEPTPQPDPEPNSRIFGYDASKNVIYHVDINPDFNEGFHYACIDQNCIPAALVGNRYERSVDGLSGTHSARFQIDGVQPNPTPEFTFTVGNNTTNTPDNNTAPNNDGQDSTIPTNNIPAGFAHLDFTTNSQNDGRVGPPPRPNPPEAIPTPTNGATPTRFGFAFDIADNRLTWRWGPSIVKAEGDSGLEMHCSQDNNRTFTKVAIENGTATIPCSGTYTYFFRYLHRSHSLNDDPAHRWIFTALFTTASRVDPTAYPSFTDGSANWMRWRHPISHDGTTAAVSDAVHNAGRLRNLDRYNLWIEDSPGNVQFNHDIRNVLRNEAMRGQCRDFPNPCQVWTNANGNPTGGPNSQQSFVVNQNPGMGNNFSYGQIIQFEITASTGNGTAQTYNDFSYYTVGCGWCGGYGDPRLKVAGRAGTTMVLPDAPAPFSLFEYNATFTQPLRTLHSEPMIDDWIVGHHLFHGIDPNKHPRESTDPTTGLFNGAPHDDVKIGERTCGDCHFRDGRGSEIVSTPKGLRLPPPTYGVGLLEAIEGREAGFGWNGDAPTVAAQVRNALINDHKVNPDEMPAKVVELITTYTELLTVPARNPGVYDRAGVADGDILFSEIGCADCHTPVQRTASTQPTHLRDLILRPYTDMKVWSVNGGRYRTPPLWGIGHNLVILRKNNRAILYMHDGAATSIDEAISQHSGDAAQARGAYNALSASQKQSIVSFVESL